MTKRPTRSPTGPPKPDQFMPDWIPPCLPTLVERPPEGETWEHEIKWDGYRVSTYLCGGRVAIRTRNKHDWTHRFPTIVAAVAALPLHQAVLDGEAVVLDDEGKSSFAALQEALGTGGRGPGKRVVDEAILYAFDLLHLDGHDLRPWKLGDCRAALLGTIAEDDPVLRFSRSWDASGADLFAAAAENGLEGIVSKRADLPYTSGRSTGWLKTKCVHDGTFVIVGYQPSSANKETLGAVHVAADEGGSLRYVGAVGSGFSHKAAQDLQKRLDAIGRPAPGVMGLKIKGARWTAPNLRVDVNFRATTREGLLRHASFKGVRED